MPHPALFAPDILLDIFLRLPQQDLLLVQRVCRMWHEFISDSHALQVALFFQPDADTSTQRPSDNEVVLNPLLRARFPSFFELSSRVPRQHAWLLGPWFDSHWAESLHSSPSSADANPDSAGAPSTVGESRDARYPELDQQRSDAYRRRGASWRRMIPCRPAPRQLQVQQHRRRVGPRSAARHATFYKMDFENCGGGGAASHDGDSAAAEASGSVHVRHLTFGLIYDVADSTFFHRIPYPAYSITFDYSFKDRVSSLPMLPAFVSGPSQTRMTVEERLKGTKAQGYSAPEQLQKELQEGKLGGNGTLVMHLSGDMLSITGHRRSPYQGQFTVEEPYAVDQIDWTDKFDYICT